MFPSASPGQVQRDVFFRILATNLKDANRHYSGKLTTWKNPFLYKNSLCDHYVSNGYCRYGVNCWYAHGEHELRQIPYSEELPDPEFMVKYLSFLGLPLNVLKNIIQQAYNMATALHQERCWVLSGGNSSVSSFSSSRSGESSPIQMEPTTFKRPSFEKFHGMEDVDKFKTVQSSASSTCSGWDHFDALLARTITESRPTPRSSPFERSFHLFGDSYPFQR